MGRQGENEKGQGLVSGFVCSFEGFIMVILCYAAAHKTFHKPCLHLTYNYANNCTAKYWWF